jgi:hypothetical protein
MCTITLSKGNTIALLRACARHAGPLWRARWSETGRVVNVRAGFHET